MTRKQFLSAYEALLRVYCPALIWPNPYLREVADSIAGNPPHTELSGSRIAQEAWESLGGQGNITTEKLKGLRE